MPADRPRPLPIETTVARVERLSHSLVRVVVRGEALAEFAEPAFADSYVKVVFRHPDGTDARRTYTVRAFDRAARELTMDFVVHGDAGLAGPWAAAARPGDDVLLQGPGGGYSPRPESSWHLLAGDESALPAIAVALERMPAGVPVTAFVEVHGPEDEIPLARPVTWLHRGDAPVGSLLVGAVRAWPQPSGVGQAFVHGEAGMVREVRRELRVTRGLPLDALSVSGYWRAGVDDEGWRAVKREWNQAVEDAERGVA